MLISSEAPTLWKLLNGILCVYKPQGMSPSFVHKILKGNIASDFNNLRCRPPIRTTFKKINASGEIIEYKAASFADNTLVVGPRYLPKDVRCKWSSSMGKFGSGVYVLGINKGTTKAISLCNARPVRVFHICGTLGIATDTFDTEGAVVEKSSFLHVQRSAMDRVLASFQAAHQKRSFDHMGVHIQSQAAYEMAALGTVRPGDGKIPYVYSMKCTEFCPPYFTIEIKCVNEYEDYLKTLIHEIGMKLHSAAACSEIRCIRYGPFSLEHALLRKHWHVQPIFENLSLCHKVLEKHKFLLNDPPPSLTKVESDINLSTFYDV